MAYEVLARKWRPQQFDDVVGQEHVTRTLRNAIETNRVAHAYLFVGPRGTGKTSMARIMAKALNCVNGPTVTPCDKCDSCREIMAGGSLDVLEIDGASNTGVDHVRDLRSNVLYAPARGPFKIYVIDEVHMLSTAAFNALLKTLEEPPAHVKFMFATTEPQKVPATILSRCQRFDLRRISTRDIVGRLEEIAKAEKIKVDADALLAIARGAEGGLRDAESALDQLIAFRGKEIKESDVLGVFGLVARKTLEELANALLQGDVPAMIRMVAALDAGGKDLQRLNAELIEYFHHALIVHYAGNDVAGLDLAEGQLESLRAVSVSMDPGRLLRVIEILTEADGRMRYSLSRRTLLETALIRGARAATVVSLDKILARLDELSAGVDDPETPAAPAHPQAPPPIAYATSSGAASAVKEDPPSTDEAGSMDERQLLSSHWHTVVEKVGTMASLAKSYLMDAKPLDVTGNHVVIGFDPEFASNVSKINFPRNVKAIQKVLGEILRREVTVEFRALDAKSTLPGDFKLDPAPAAPPAEEHKKKEPTPEGSPKTPQEWLKNPIVLRALELFNGGVIDIRQ